MPTTFRVESIVWERVNLTLDFRLAWIHPDGRTLESVGPASVDVHEPGGREPDEDELVVEDTAPPEVDPDESPAGAEAEAALCLKARNPGRHLEDEPTADKPIDDTIRPQLRRIFIRDTVAEHPVRWAPLGDGGYRVQISISNFAERTFLPTGTWKFFAQLDSSAEAGAVWDLARLDELDSLTRVFLFSRNREAYTVSFGITVSDVDPLFAMRAYKFGRKAAPASRRRRRSPFSRVRKSVKRFTSPARRRKVAQVIYDVTAKMEAIRRSQRRSAAGPDRPRVLFASEWRTVLEGNLLAVRDRMVERSLDKQLDLRYSTRIGPTATSRSYLRLVQELARADIVLLDDYFPPLGNLQLKPACRIIQVWHAGSGFKNVGYSRFGKLGSPGLTTSHRKYTYAVTASRHLKHVYAEVFGIEEEAVIPTGLPRIDTFLDPAAQTDARALAYEAYPALRGKRVIMFAPTFRGSGAPTAYYNYSLIDFQALYDMCGEDTVVAFRMHHFIQERVPIPESMRDRFIDVSDYRNGNDLLLVTDLLITDYSSIIFEFSLLDRPMLFFAYDEEIYSAVRGFHRPYKDTAPGKVCHTFGELVEAISTEDFEFGRVAAFRAENFDVIDTHSSDRLIDWLILGDPPESTVVAEPIDTATTSETPSVSSTP